METRVFRDKIKCLNIERKLSNIEKPKKGFTIASKELSTKEPRVVLCKYFLNKKDWISLYLVFSLSLFSFFCLLDFFETKSVDDIFIEDKLMIEESAKIESDVNASKQNQAISVQVLSSSLEFYNSEQIKIVDDYTFIKNLPQEKRKFFDFKGADLSFDLDNP